MEGESPRSLRLSGKLRSLLIGYGVAAYGFISYTARLPGAEGAPSLAGTALSMLLTGLALQALVVVLKAVMRRVERAQGLEGHLTPLAVYIFELVCDAVTVLLFALGTLRATFSFADAV